MMFSQTFIPVLGVGSAILVTLLGFRIIELVFFMIGFHFGNAKRQAEATPTINPNQLYDTVDGIVKDIITKQTPKV